MDAEAREPYGSGNVVSVGGPCYPPFATAVLAPGRINLAAGINRLLHRRESCAIAYGTLTLSQFRE